MSSAHSCLHSTPFFIFFHDNVAPKIYTISLHDALPISRLRRVPRVEVRGAQGRRAGVPARCGDVGGYAARRPRSGEHRSEEHTSELQSPDHLVRRLLLGTKKHKKTTLPTTVPTTTPLPA